VLPTLIFPAQVLQKLAPFLADIAIFPGFWVGVPAVWVLPSTATPRLVPSLALLSMTRLVSVTLWQALHLLMVTSKELLGTLHTLVSSQCIIPNMPPTYLKLNVMAPDSVIISRLPVSGYFSDNPQVTTHHLCRC
jgi:hypothetical protein